MADVALNVLAGELAIDVASSTGLGGRTTNQDAIEAMLQDDLACFVVCDGVAGQPGGDVAAAIIVDAVRQRFASEAAFGPAALRSYIQHAIAMVQQRQDADPACRHMSATIAALLIDRKNRSAIWTHIGDTRVYLFRDGAVSRVTKDHSMVQQFIDAGICSPEDLTTHPKRHRLYAAVGAMGDAFSEPLVDEMTIAAGDAFLVCTDGFWEILTDDEMSSTLKASDTAEKWLAQMNDLIQKSSVHEARSRDNHSAFALMIR